MTYRAALVCSARVEAGRLERQQASPIKSNGTTLLSYHTQREIVGIHRKRGERRSVKVLSSSLLHLKTLDSLHRSIYDSTPIFERPTHFEYLVFGRMRRTSMAEQALNWHASHRSVEPRDSWMAPPVRAKLCLTDTCMGFFTPLEKWIEGNLAERRRVNRAIQFMICMQSYDNTFLKVFACLLKAHVAEAGAFEPASSVPEGDQPCKRTPGIRLTSDTERIPGLSHVNPGRDLSKKFHCDWARGIMPLVWTLRHTAPRASHLSRRTSVYLRIFPSS